MKTITRHLMNPGRFLRLAEFLQPMCGAIAAVLFAWGIYLSLWASPPDYQQGELVRIMYLHVPAAWMGLLLYAPMAVGAGIGLIMRTPVADVFCRAAAPVGAVLVAVCLVTGSIWGKPTWGAWWVWDARLTSVLVLFLIYCGYIALRGAFEDTARGTHAGQVLLLAGAVNLPIVKFSVDWWHSLHQPASVLREGGAAIAPAMLWPLLVMAAAYLFFTAFVVLVRMRALLITDRMNALAFAEERP